MPLSPPILRRALPILAATLLLAPCALAQTIDSQEIKDPANLAGERVSPQALADTLPINHGAPALEQLLLKLRTRASMMMIVAHPDDEDGGLLTYESRGQGARVATLTLTRGEGGQNLMSADFNDALGLIRTQELLAADRYMGVDQMFGTEVDFGFSKTKEETFQKWTHERVLYDAVRCVRLYRPLVLASVFVGGVTDGHGHHQVAGEITQEVFTAAADPKVFPEMGLPAWTPLKVYARIPFFRVTPQGMFDYATGKYSPVRFHNYVTGKDITHEPLATVEIHEGEVSQRLGMEGLSYVQFARKGLALQKTQIGANVRLAPAGVYDVGYTLMASRVGVVSGTRSKTPPEQEQGLFDGIDTTLPGLATLAPAAAHLRETLTVIDGRIAEAQHLFNPDHLELTAPPLREALRTLDTLLTTTEASPLDPTQKFNLLHELRIKRVQLNDALVLAIGMSLSPTIEVRDDSPSPGTIVRGQYIYIQRLSDIKPKTNSSLIDKLVPVRPGEHAIQAAPGIRPIQATPGVLVNQPVLSQHMTELVLIAKDAPLTRPYFTRKSLEQPFYDVTQPALRNAPSTPAPITLDEILHTDRVPIEIRQSLETQGTQPHQIATITPEVSVRVFPSLGILPTSSSENPFTVTVQCRSTLSKVQGTLRLQLPAQWRSEPTQASFTIDHIGQQQELKFRVYPQAIEIGSHYQITAVAETEGRQYTESFRPVGYPGLTYTNYYTPATYRATAVDVTTAPNLRIAYLPGTGDAVTDFLPSLGVTPAIVTLADLTPEKLKQYDAVLLGVRAYAAHPELAGTGSKPLLDYAKNGGVVIVQYNNSVYDADSAPYPLSVPGDPGHNVVVEADAVTLLKPASPLLVWPNKITAADFNGWVEERGHGFAASFDSRYEELLETHDPDQDPQRGGLLVAQVGRGAYVYCALALYRQLPEGVPGAYRLLANLLSYAKNPQRP